MRPNHQTLKQFYRAKTRPRKKSIIIECNTKKSFFASIKKKFTQKTGKTSWEFQTSFAFTLLYSSKQIMTLSQTLDRQHSLKNEKIIITITNKTVCDRIQGNPTAKSLPKSLAKRTVLRFQVSNPQRVYESPHHMGQFT